MATNSSDQGEEMRRKAELLVKFAATCANLNGVTFVDGERIGADDKGSKMLSRLSQQVLDVVPLLCEQVEAGYDLAARLFDNNKELQILSRDLAASLRSNPNVTNS